VRFFTAAGLINLLTEAQAGLRLSHLERNLVQMDLLIIDETGRARPALHNLDAGRPCTPCLGRRLADSVGLAINQVGPW